MLELQRTVGNCAVRRLTSGNVVQTKLQVGPAGDHFEREADRVADEVMRNLSTTVTPQRDQEETRVSRSAIDGVVGLEGGPLGTDTEAAIERDRGQGARLPDPLRQSMEGAFGSDFSGVRVHDGPSADALNRSMQSRAFTVGSDIFLARGQYQPQSRSGQRLLAHELTHTVQQGAAPTAVSRTDGAEVLEDLQRSIGNRATIGYLSSLDAASPPVVQRKIFTKDSEKLDYAKVLRATKSKSKVKGTPNVLTGVGGIPQPFQTKVQTAVTKMNTINTALNAPGAGTDVWEDGGATADLVRTPHDNRDGWLANPTAYVAPAGASAAIAAWGATFDQRYLELTVDSSWRVVWDLNTNTAFLTLHYDHDGTYSPFFLISGLTF